jgi:hypothetical protein
LKSRSKKSRGEDFVPQSHFNLENKFMLSTFLSSPGGKIVPTHDPLQTFYRVFKHLKNITRKPLKSAVFKSKLISLPIMFRKRENKIKKFTAKSLLHSVA